MITDRIQLAGINAYLRDPDDQANINLAANTNLVNAGVPVSVQTLPLSKGKQVEISGIQLLIEADDLGPLFPFQFNVDGDPAPLMSFSVMKEMFAGLFADPYKHRVHNIAGYLDFNEGVLQNGRIMEIEGIPTIVSIGRETCSWESKIYTLPDPITIDALAWELASSINNPSNTFKYSLNISCFSDVAGADLIGTIGTGNLVDADFSRAVQLDETGFIPGVKSFQVYFEAYVNIDANISERKLPGFNEKIGRPLLRAVNIIELLIAQDGTNNSVYDIHSLTELKSLCSDFELSETPGPSITRVMATLDLNAILVHSEREVSVNNKFEFVQLNLFSSLFARFEAKVSGDILIRNNNS